MTLHNKQDAIKQAVEAGYDFDSLANDGKEPKLTHVRNEFEIQARHLRKGGYQMVRAIYEDANSKEYGAWKRWDYVVGEAKRFFQDPAFWQALGKARGWKGEYQFGGSQRSDNPEVTISRGIPTWLYHALRYFEPLLSGGDIQAFWQSLP